MNISRLLFKYEYLIIKVSASIKVYFEKNRFICTRLKQPNKFLAKVL
jgi:hypothetical protein